MSYQIPMGPYHPGLEEPYKLEMICEARRSRMQNCISVLTFAASSISRKHATTSR